MAARTRKLNAYQKKVRSDALALQAKTNAQSMAQIKQNQKAADAAFVLNTKQNEQTRRNNNLAHGTNLANMTERVQDEAASLGNARGSYAGDYMRASAERQGYDRSFDESEQSYFSAKDSLLKQGLQNAFDYQNALTQYNLELQRQKNADWAATHR